MGIALMLLTVLGITFLVMTAPQAKKAISGPMEANMRRA